MKLGETQVLTVVKRVDFGVYLGSDEEKVLLPAKQVPEGIEPGDPVEVFLYRDSSDRLIATTRKPKLELGGLALLRVADTGRMGAFLDWGLEKDLLLPFREQTTKVKKGDSCLVSLYIDKSGRLCATMKIYSILETDSPYKKNDIVTGHVYENSEEFGVFVAVDERYSARIPKREIYRKIPVGSRVEARVSEVKGDGKLELSLRDKIPEQMEKDAAKLLQKMEQYGGKLPFSEKASPEQIKEELGMSKAAFKRAVGRLLKRGLIVTGEHEIRRK
jgi:uncharacterized protein